MKNSSVSYSLSVSHSVSFIVYLPFPFLEPRQLEIIYQGLVYYPRQVVHAVPGKYFLILFKALAPISPGSLAGWDSSF